MQSTDTTKKKRTRKASDEPATAQAVTPAIEEATKPKRNATAAKKPAADTTTAVKQHRGAAKKVLAPQSESAPAAVPEIAMAAAAAASGSVAPSPARIVAESDIAALAYSFWEQRGCQGGSPEEDWVRAERELAAR